MKIYTLGTSHGDATYCRFNSSTLYEINGAFYLLDCGAPAEALMIRSGLDFRKIRGIFITHMHADHAGGLPTMLKALMKHRCDGQFTRVFLPQQEAIDPLTGWMQAMHLPVNKDVFSLEVTAPGEIYRDENLCVSAIPTRHLIAPEKPITFAYTLCGDRRILHTGDLRKDFSDFPTCCQQQYFDACVCECTHYPPQLATPVLRTAKLGRLIFSHVHNPWHGAAGEAELLAHYTDLPYPVCVAHDGDTFQI